MALQPGELRYLAVDAGEPAGKPIIACRKVQVALELASEGDRDVLRQRGLAAMRQGRLARLARQAQVQGGLLTVEDLAYLTCSSTATVKRDLAACRTDGVAVPGVRRRLPLSTRGSVRPSRRTSSGIQRSAKSEMIWFKFGVRRLRAAAEPHTMFVEGVGRG